MLRESPNGKLEMLVLWPPKGKAKLGSSSIATHGFYLRGLFFLDLVQSLGRQACNKSTSFLLPVLLDAT